MKYLNKVSIATTVTSISMAAEGQPFLFRAAAESSPENRTDQSSQVLADSENYENYYEQGSSHFLQENYQGAVEITPKLSVSILTLWRPTTIVEFPGAS